LKNTSLTAAIILVCCIIGALLTIVAFHALGLEFGKEKTGIKLSLFTTTLVMLRAGIAEEVFFRGYIIERLQVLMGSKWMAIALSLVPFALLHYRQGISGILISFVLGGILTGMYLWKRDLKANMIAHFMVDFIPNVLVPLITAG